MTDLVDPVALEIRPAGPLHALEIWSAPDAVAARFAEVFGFPLPGPGRAAGDDVLFALRDEPAVWLVGGERLDLAAIEAALGRDGALTAIGGGLRRIRLTGRAWRALLTVGGVFDAEAPAFGPGCVAATVIDHVPLRLRVVAEDVCDAYVPASHMVDLVHFWAEAARTLRYDVP